MNEAKHNERDDKSMRWYGDSGIVSKSVMSLNELSTASARPTLPLYVSVLVVWGIAAEF